MLRKSASLKIYIETYPLIFTIPLQLYIYSRETSKDPCKNVYRFILKSQKPETQMSNNNKMSKQTAVHSCNEILPSNKRNEPLIYTIWMNLENVIFSISQDIRAHTVWFHFYKVLEQAELLYGERKQNMHCLWTGRDMRKLDGWQKSLS